MGNGARTVFLFDVDNTLLDNDAVQDDLSAHLDREVGLASRDRYWQIFEQLRAELGYADYLGALQRYRLEHQDDAQLLRVSFFLLDYPFADRLYPGALAALARCRQLGPTVILSDGDVVFQPRKVQRSGLWDAVEQRVLIYLHKEQMLESVAQRFEWVRQRVAFYGSTPAYFPVFALHGLDDLGHQLHAMSREGKWAEMTKEVPDDVAHLFAAVGRHDQIVGAIERRFGGLVDALTLRGDGVGEVPPDLVQDIRRVPHRYRGPKE